MGSRAGAGVDAVIFSWAALVDARETSSQACREATRRVLGHEFPRTAAEDAIAAGMPAPELFGMLSDDQFVVAQLIEAYDGAYLRHLSAGVRVRTGAADLLESLQGEVAIGVITSETRGLSEAAVTASGLVDRIGVLVCEDGSVRRLPDPATLVEALERCRTRPSRAVYVATRSAEVIAGRSLGTRTVVLRAADALDALLAGAGPIVAIDGFDELLVIVRDRGALPRDLGGSDNGDAVTPR